jgi:hypothetical protein
VKCSGLVPVRLMAGRQEVLRSWPAGLVPGLRDVVLDSICMICAGQHVVVRRIPLGRERRYGWQDSRTCWMRPVERHGVESADDSVPD